MTNETEISIVLSPSHLTRSVMEPPSPPPIERKLNGDIETNRTGSSNLPRSRLG